MNRADRPPTEAQIEYVDADIRIVRPGSYVTCGVTGVRIALENLRYWSVERQEAYASPEAVLARLKGEAAQR